MIRILKSKIHGARITHKNLHYTGSLGIDGAIMERVGLLPYEEVLVVNLNNGARFITYAIEEERGSGRIVLNGAAVRLGEVGDSIIIMAFRYVDEKDYHKFEPKIVVLDENNRIVS